MTFAKKSSRLTACVIGLLSGGIGVFAYSPFDYWPIAFISTLGLIWLVTTFDKGDALLGTFLWGVAYFAVGVNWVHVSMIQFGGVPELVSYLAVLLLAAYLALYPLLFAYVNQRFRLQNPWVLAAIFTFTEYLRGVIFTGFPWLQFGYALIDSPFAGLAPILGVEGLSFFVVVASGYFLQIFRKMAERAFKLQSVALLSLLLIATWGTSWLRFVEVDESRPSQTISLVQGNIEQKMKWDPDYFNQTVLTYQKLISQVLSRSDVVILPESAIPATEAQIEPLLQELQRAAQQRGSEVIIGTLHQTAQGLFNSAVVVGNAEKPYSLYDSARFNKHHLVPFGEYVPFGTLLDWMREVFILPVNLSQGTFIQSPLLAGERRFNTAICYEIIFTHQVQQNQKAHLADYLLTISNDAWFGSSIGPWQHFQMARMRALELGRPLIRATNTGITAFVDAYGKVESQAPQFKALVLSREVKAYKGETPFTIWGNWALYGLCALILLVRLLRRRI